MQTAITPEVDGSWLEATQLVFSTTSFYSSLFRKAQKLTATTVPPTKEHPGLIKTLGYYNGSSFPSWKTFMSSGVRFSQASPRAAFRRTPAYCSAAAPTCGRPRAHAGCYRDWLPHRTSQRPSAGRNLTTGLEIRATESGMGAPPVSAGCG